MSFQEYADSVASKIRFGECNKKALLGAIGILVLIAASALFIAFGPKANDAEADEASEPEIVEAGDAENQSEEATSNIFVHVAGCVAAPGVYALKQGARVSEAIELAGGFTPEAASEAVNLARVLEDAEQIVIPEKTEAVADASISSESASAAEDASPNGATAGATSKVNINTASSSELQTINGIGASKAQKIISYRETNGRFKSVEDLLNVSGIGEKTLESIRDSICV